MVNRQKLCAPIILVIFLFGGNHLLLAQYGYPIDISFDVRNCQDDEDPGCTLYSFYSFLKWTGEQYEQFNSHMEALLKFSLKSKLNHWQFVQGQESKVSLRGAVVDEGAGLTKTILELSLISPRLQRELILDRLTIYPQSYFETRYIQGVQKEKEVLERVLATWLNEENNIRNLETRLKDLVPIALENHPLDKTAGKLVLPLPKDHFKHLSSATFWFMINGTRDRLTGQSKGVWSSFPGKQDPVFGESLLVDLTDINDRPFADLPAEERNALPVGPAFLINFDETNPLPIF